MPIRSMNVYNLHLKPEMMNGDKRLLCTNKVGFFFL